jgi:hypothetical protein
MSTRELRRAEVLARVKNETLRLVDAAKMLELNYRQMKRLWKALSRRRSPGSSTAAWEEARIERTQRHSGGRCCSCSGRSIRGRNRSGLDPTQARKTELTR